MKSALWIGGALLFAVAAVSIWFAFHDPRFVAALALAAAGAALPVVLRSSRATRLRAQRDAREGRMGDPHAGREK